MIILYILYVLVMVANLLVGVLYDDLTCLMVAVFMMVVYNGVLK